MPTTKLLNPNQFKNKLDSYHLFSKFFVVYSTETSAIFGFDTIKSSLVSFNVVSEFNEDDMSRLVKIDLYVIKKLLLFFYLEIELGAYTKN